jgi:hypothetical protein
LWGRLITLVSPARFVQVILIKNGFIMGDKDKVEATPSTRNRETLWEWKWSILIVPQVEALFIILPPLDPASCPIAMKWELPNPDKVKNQLAQIASMLLPTSLDMGNNQRCLSPSVPENRVQIKIQYTKHPSKVSPKKDVHAQVLTLCSK